VGTFVGLCVGKVEGICVRFAVRTTVGDTVRFRVG